MQYERTALNPQSSVSNITRAHELLNAKWRDAWKIRIKNEIDSISEDHALNPKQYYERLNDFGKTHQSITSLPDRVQRDDGSRTTSREETAEEFKILYSAIATRTRPTTLTSGFHPHQRSEIERKLRDIEIAEEHEHDQQWQTEGAVTNIMDDIIAESLCEHSYCPSSDTCKRKGHGDDGPCNGLQTARFHSLIGMPRAFHLERPHQTTPAPWNYQQREAPSITRNEVITAINELKLHKSPGGDGIRGELFRYGGEGIVEIVTLFFSIFWRTEFHPSEQWDDGIVAPLYKGKGRRDKVNNYRPVTLTSVACKLYERVIKNRIQPRPGEITATQSAYQKHISCLEPLTMLYEKAADQKRKGKKLYCLFVDITKAFPSSDQDVMWWKLHTSGQHPVKGRIWRIIRKLYRSARSRVRTKKPFTEQDWYDITAGCREGSVLSPSIFLRFINDVIGTIFPHSNCSLLGIWIGMLLFADDMILLAESLEELQTMADVLSRFFCRWRIRFSLSKTNVVVYGETQAERTQRMETTGRVRITVGAVWDGISSDFMNETGYTCDRSDTAVAKELDEYRYLGITLHWSLSWERHANMIIGKMATAARKVYAMGAYQGLLNEYLTCLLYRTYVSAAMAFLPSLWCTDTSTMRKLTAIHSAFMARMMHQNSGGVTFTRGITASWIAGTPTPYAIRFLDATIAGAQYQGMSSSKVCIDIHNASVQQGGPCLATQVLNILREATRQDNIHQVFRPSSQLLPQEQNEADSDSHQQLQRTITSWSTFNEVIMLPESQRSELFEEDKSAWRCHLQRLTRQVDLNQLLRKIHPGDDISTFPSHYERFIRRHHPRIRDIPSFQHHTRSIFSHWAIREFSQHANISTLIKVITGNSSLLCDDGEHWGSLNNADRICGPCLFRRDIQVHETSDHVFTSCCLLPIQEARELLDQDAVEYCTFFNSSYTNGRHITWIPFSLNTADTWISAVHLDEHAQPWSHSRAQRFPDTVWIPVVRLIIRFMNTALQLHRAGRLRFNEAYNSRTSWLRILQHFRTNRQTTIIRR
jgi:hypothetical protein